MDWKERANEAQGKLWRDDKEEWSPRAFYLQGVKDALEEAAQVASEHGASEARWAEHYRTKEPDLNEESGCLAQLNAAIEIERDIRALGEGL